MFIRSTAYYLFAFIILLTISCGKDDGPPAPPVDPPRGNDSLGIGWQKIPMPDSLYFQDVFFVDEMTGYLTAINYLAKSIDGGLTWTQFNNLPQQGGFSNLYFTDALHGCAISGGGIITTENGGQSWQRGARGGYDVQFISKTEGFLCAFDGLSKTIDGGITWTKLPANTGEITALFFFNNNLGWAAAYNQVSKTENGGNSFGSGVNAPLSDGIYTMQFTDNNHGWGSSTNGTIVRTINGGSSWENIVKDGGLSDIHFFDNNNGFLFSGPNIYQTNNGGTTLLKQAVIRKTEIIEIHFVNPNHGWAVGDRGGLYRFSR